MFQVPSKIFTSTHFTALNPCGNQVFSGRASRKTITERSGESFAFFVPCADSCSLSCVSRPVLESVRQDARLNSSWGVDPGREKNRGALALLTTWGHVATDTFFTITFSGSRSTYLRVDLALFSTFISRIPVLPVASIFFLAVL